MMMLGTRYPRSSPLAIYLLAYLSFDELIRVGHVFREDEWDL